MGQMMEVKVTCRAYILFDFLLASHGFHDFTTEKMVILHLLGLNIMILIRTAMILIPQIFLI
jgi:hypothetical protein